MLSKEDNELLTRVGPGTPGNTFFKHIWLPFMRSDALEADGTPEKVELLGEKYIAFRDTDGNVGFMEEGCPHRGISLSLARNEKNALTCIFHGWSFNAKGECVAAPTEPNKDFCKKVRVRAFPTREAGGAIWVYLAPGEPARFPDYAYTYEKKENIYCRRGFVRGNWMSVVEGFLDPAHVGILHRNDALSATSGSLAGTADIQAPKFSIDGTDYGFRTFARRERDDGTSHIRVTEYIFPVTTQVATTEDEIKFGPMCVPVNDTMCMFWVFLWGTPEQVAEGGQTRMKNDPNDWTRDLLKRDQPGLGQDREAMKNGNWSGFKALPAEDVAVVECVPMVDRSQEFLGSADTVVIRVRHGLLQHLRAIRDGNWRGFGDTSRLNYRAIRAHSLVLPSEVDMAAHVQELYESRAESLNSPPPLAAE